MRACVLALTLLSGIAFAQLDYRPNREHRSFNTDLFEIAIQKNGELDVALASGAPVFLDAFPMVWIDGTERPRPMTVDGRWSGRFNVNDPLGQGHGMMLQKEECTWSLRTYPTKPFLAVQVAYRNTTKKPLAIRALMPWCVGEPHKGLFTLGGEASQVVRRDGAIALDMLDADGEHLGSRNLALYDAGTKRSMIAGFLTQSAARAAFSLESMKSKEHESFERLRFACIFDPPVTLNPGETLESDVLYLAFAESDPTIALERFVRAAQAANQLPTRPGAWAHRWFVDGEPYDPFGELLGENHREMMERPARPLDLFGSRSAGTWLWSGADDRSPLLIASEESLGGTLERLSPAPVHVYDVLNGRYLGISTTNAESRLVSLRRVFDRAQLISYAGNPFAPDAEWDGSTLSGTFVQGDTAEVITILLNPESEVHEVTTSAGEWLIERDGPILLLKVSGASGQGIDWTVTIQESR